MRGSAEAEQRFIRSEPLKRFGEPSEIGEAVAWLCSDQCVVCHRTADAGRRRRIRSVT